METGKRDIRTYKKGEVIFEEGDKANCMYDIHYGTVGIYANYGTKQAKLLTTLLAEEFFGEMGLVDLEPRSATAVALEKGTRVEIITREDFASFFQERPGRVLMIMQHMSQRLRNLTKDYLEVCETVVEAVEAEKTGKAKNEGLLKRMKKFNDIYCEDVQNHVKNKGGI